MKLSGPTIAVLAWTLSGITMATAAGSGDSPQRPGGAASSVVTASRPKAVLSTRIVRPVTRSFAVGSPAARPPVRFWRWRSPVDSPAAATSRPRLVAEKVYRLDHISASRDLAPAGLNRFVSSHHAAPTAPVRLCPAPMDSR